MHVVPGVRAVGALRVLPAATYLHAGGLTVAVIGGDGGPFQQRALFVIELAVAAAPAVTTTTLRAQFDIDGIVSVAPALAFIAPPPTTSTTTTPVVHVVVTSGEALTSFALCGGGGSDGGTEASALAATSPPVPTCDDGEDAPMTLGGEAICALVAPSLMVTAVRAAAAADGEACGGAQQRASGGDPRVWWWRVAARGNGGLGCEFLAATTPPLPAGVSRGAPVAAIVPVHGPTAPCCSPTATTRACVVVLDAAGRWVVWHAATRTCVRVAALGQLAGPMPKALRLERPDAPTTGGSGNARGGLLAEVCVAIAGGVERDATLRGGGGGAAAGGGGGGGLTVIASAALARPAPAPQARRAGAVHRPVVSLRIVRRRTAAELEEARQFAAARGAHAAEYGSDDAGDCRRGGTRETASRAKERRAAAAQRSNRGEGSRGTATRR